MKKSKPRKPYRKTTNGRRKAAPASAAAKRAALRQRKAASRKARTVKRHAMPVTIAKFKIDPVRKHVSRLCRGWRREERELGQALEVQNAEAARVHKRNMGKLKAEMRRVVRAVEAVKPLAEGTANGQRA